MLEVFRADKANTSLPASVHEVVILTVGAACHASYELYAHAAIGASGGLAEGTISAIVAGATPKFDSEADALGYEFVRQLLHADRVDDVTYARAMGAFGERGVVDLVLLIGLYLTVSALVNVFEVPVPAGDPPRAFDNSRR
jgi:4-carboxymuconolactone decarboxylase